MLIGLIRAVAVLAPLPGIAMFAVAVVADPANEGVAFCVIYWKFALISGFAILLALYSFTYMLQWASKQ